MIILLTHTPSLTQSQTHQNLLKMGKGKFNKIFLGSNKSLVSLKDELAGMLNPQPQGMLLTKNSGILTHINRKRP